MLPPTISVFYFAILFGQIQANTNIASIQSESGKFGTSPLRVKSKLNDVLMVNRNTGNILNWLEKEWAAFLRPNSISKWNMRNQKHFEMKHRNRRILNKCFEFNVFHFKMLLISCSTSKGCHHKKRSHFHSCTIEN